MSTSKVLGFVLIMTSVVAMLLALLQNGLKDIHDKNEALYSKKATLGAVASHLDIDYTKIESEQVTEIFKNQIKQFVVNSKGELISADDVMSVHGYKGGLAENLDLKKEKKKSPEDKLMPFYVFEKSNGKKYYIFYARGKGLWDEIWGNIALEDDMNTIAGVSFDHKAETPGLGAEIKDNKAWVKQFIGKKFYNDTGDFKSILVRKGGAKDPVFEVDAISGATITGDGVGDMLAEGMKEYETYFEKIKGSN